MFLIVGLSIFLFFIIIIFSFPQFSPIPYFPTNSEDLSLIIKTLSLKNDQIIIDLGAGDGVVIFETARVAINRRLRTKFIAVDINPVLILIMHIRRFFHPNKRNIKIIWVDLFKLNYSSLTTNYQPLTTFYLYVSPWLIEKIISKIKKDIEEFDVVSYFYPIKSLKKKEKITQGKNKIFSYTS